MTVGRCWDGGLGDSGWAVCDCLHVPMDPKMGGIIKCREGCPLHGVSPPALLRKAPGSVGLNMCEQGPGMGS